IGVSARTNGDLPAEHLPFKSILTVLFPDRWGRPSGVEIEPFPNAQYLERTFYPGVVALLLAALAWFRRDMWRQMAPFAMVALRVPGIYWLAVHLPVLKQVEAQRLHFTFEFAVAVLAAFGLQSLLEAPSGSRTRFAVPLVAVVLGLVALATAGIGAGDVGRL